MLEWMDKETVLIDDIQRLINEKQVETDFVEFKGTLPAKGTDVDPWMTGEQKIGVRARDKLLSEIIAMANTHGGWLFIGIEEADENPAYASKIQPIPFNEELARKLHEISDALIDPKLPQIKFHAVPYGNKGEGILAVRVKRSSIAPHRLETNKEVYIRRNVRCVKATMREIQDLTLRTHRHVAEALWTVNFETAQGDRNGGVIVLEQGKLFGGDGQFYYEGTFEVNNGKMTADFRVKHYHGEQITAFGDSAREFSIRAKGKISSTLIQGTLFRADIPNTEVTFTMTRRENLP